MPKRTDIKSILILGAGPIVIGQACEFDYSGAQACKALREEGYRVILVNSNPATIMTDPEMADATYIEPIHWEVVRKIIEKERPDAVLPTMGGQTALNCALELELSLIHISRASRRGEESILIGHAGHPEVEGTMGQYNNPQGGMYLVESPEDVLKLEVKNDARLSFMTQTTLSVDDLSLIHI